MAWLGTTPYLNRTGLLLSQFVEAGTPGEGVQEPALVTIISAGSHSPYLSVGKLRVDVASFLEIFRNLTNGRMVTLLTMAVCIEKIPEHHGRKFGTWEMLMRNNYRIMALNEIVLDASRKLHTATFNLFSWSMSAGCDHFADAVHMKAPIYSEFAKAIASAWFPWAIDVRTSPPEYS
jgi:hypothetical protein